jgi:hypothetical protein
VISTLVNKEAVESADCIGTKGAVADQFAEEWISKILSLLELAVRDSSHKMTYS